MKVLKILKYKIKRHQMKYLGLEIIDDKIKFNDNIQIEVQGERKW